MNKKRKPSKIGSYEVEKEHKTLDKFEDKENVQEP
jgi:hypothetical protein